MLAVLVAQSLGLLIGACVQDMGKAQLLAQTVTLTSVLIGKGASGRAILGSCPVCFFLLCIFSVRIQGKGALAPAVYAAL